MKVIDFFNDELNINLTLNDLYDICSALANEGLNESHKKRMANAKRAWELREKIGNKIQFINKNYEII